MVNTIKKFFGFGNPQFVATFNNGRTSPINANTMTGASIINNPSFRYSPQMNGFVDWGTNANGDLMGPPIPIDMNNMNGMLGIDAQGNNFRIGLDNNAGGFTAGNVLGGLSGLLQGAGGLLNAYTGLKSLEMAKDQFGFQKALANRNLANQAKIINNTYDNAAVVSANLVGGGMDSAGRVSDTDAATRSRIVEEGKKKHVDGSPI